MYDFNSSLSNNNSKTHGIKVFFQIDVQICRAMQLKFNENILCFSEIESVAAYLGVASAKNVMQDVGFKINAAEAIIYKSQSKHNEKSNFFFGIVVLFFILIICIIVVLQITNRKRKFVCAPIFRPLPLRHSKFFYFLYFKIYFR